MLTESNSQGVIIVDMSVQVLLGSVGHTRQTSFVIPDSQGAGGKIIALTGSCDGRNGHSLTCFILGCRNFSQACDMRPVLKLEPICRAS